MQQQYPLLCLCLLITKKKSAPSVAVSTHHANQSASARKTAVEGMQNSRVILFSAEDINLSLSPCTRAGFNETQGNITSFEASSPLSNLIETDQHIQKLLESE